VCVWLWCCVCAENKHGIPHLQLQIRGRLLLCHRVCITQPAVRPPHIHPHTHTHTHTHAHTHTHIRTILHTHTDTRAHTHKNTILHTHTKTHTKTHTHTHTHTHMPLPSIHSTSSRTYHER